MTSTTTITAGPTRVEHDSLGSLEIPADALWGIHSARALQNFPISGRPVGFYADLVAAFGMVKQAAAMANRDLGLLPDDVCGAIVAACERLRAGEHHDAFVVDVIQGGAGTSTNMCANEVIANLALRELGRAPGDYAVVHPIDHVNRSQSTNDVYPTVVKLALVAALEKLLEETLRLEDAFAAKGMEFLDVLKVGRTQLQDAVPMTLGQEFGGFAHTIAEDRARLAELIPLLCEINLGATAIGTGITADPRYAGLVREHLSALSGRRLLTAPDLIEATSDTGVFVLLSGVLKRTAIKVSKICNDLRLLSSGPQFGFGEINLPSRQAGSSIMPGKVNPVIPEVVNQIVFSVLGADVTISAAAEGGQLQLNAFEPVIAHSLLQSIQWLGQGFRTLRVNCVEGITANRERLAEQVEGSVGIVTALTPYIGYGPAARLAKQALLTSASIADLVVEEGLLDRTQVDALLQPALLSGMQTTAVA
jgi:aspartate ammonia-lyase